MTPIKLAKMLGYRHGNKIASAMRAGESVTIPRIAWSNPAYEATYEAAKAHAISVGSR
jgi:hypothetical protein